jgi:hypothetical protein
MLAIETKYQKEMFSVLSNRNEGKPSFVVPKGLSDEELLVIMRERKVKTKLHG